jgi:hypothetical protein
LKKRETYLSGNIVRKILMQWGWEADCVNLDQERPQHHTLVSKVMNLCPSKRLETSPVAELLSVAQRKLKIMAVLI